MLKSFVAVGLLFLLAFGPPAEAGNDLTGEQVYERITSERPRLYFRPGDIPALRERCRTFQRDAYERIKDSVDSELSTPGSARNCAETALVYLVTGDAAYAEAGRRKLLAQVDSFRRNASALRSWRRRSTDQRRYLYLATDWLWEAMPPSERRQVAEDLVYVARQWLEDSPGWLRDPYMGGYNQWSNAFLVGALLARSGVADEAARELLLAGYDPYWTMMQGRFQMAQDDGGIIAGFNYAVHNYLKMNLDFLLVMKNAAGVDLFERDYSLRNAGIWFAYGMHIPWRLPKIGDSGDGRRDFDSGSAITILSAAAGLYQDPVAQQLARELGNSPPGTLPRGAHPLLELLLADPRLPGALPDSSYPRARHFEGLGHVYMRTDWTPDATHALFFCEDAVGNHQHDDVGSFLIYRGGELAADTAGRIHTTLSHNTLLLKRGDEGVQRSSRSPGRRPFDRLLPYPFPAPFDMGEIVAFETNEHYTYVAADIARAYPEGRASELVRHFLWFVPNTFVIFDRVTTPPDVEAVWQVCALEEPQVEGRQAVITASERTVWGQTERGGQLFIRSLLPRDAVLAKTYQELTGAEGSSDSIWRITARSAGANPDDPFLHVLYAATPEEETGPAVDLVHQRGRVGARVQADGRTYHVLFNTTGPPGGTVRIAPDGVRRELTTEVQPQTGDGRR